MYFSDYFMHKGDIIETNGACQQKELAAFGLYAEIYSLSNHPAQEFLYTLIESLEFRNTFINDRRRTDNE